MKIVSPKQMSEIDKQAIVFGIPGLLLMENAGIKCWDFIKNNVKQNNWDNTHILIIAGTGNNGGDALVVARQAWISGIRNIKIVLSENNGNEHFNLHRKICENLEIPILIYKKNEELIETAIETSGVIIDGITGTGLRGSLHGNAAELVFLVNSSPGIRISIDIPSGLGEEFETHFPVINADITLAIGLPKTILYYPSMRIFAGKIKVLSIGFPPDLLDNVPGTGRLYNNDDLMLPDIPVWAYKGTRGHTAVFAGSEGTIGAAVLSSSAAGRARSGLVTLFVDRDIYSSVAAQLVSIMVKQLEPDYVKDDLAEFTSVLAGPGWGINQRAHLLSLLFESGVKGVLDADGLNVLPELESVFKNEPGHLKGHWVFTPHPGEFSRISGIDKEKFLLSPLPYLKMTSARYGAVIVLKSHVTFIVTPEGEYSVVDGMNPALGTGGSGDILSGIIAGLMSQGMSPYESAVMGVILHQNIGKECFNDKGWFLAEDLLPYISREINKRKLHG